MKNKLFLTSMVAVMLAFPAYATLVNDPDAQHQSGTIALNSSSESCDSDPLTYQGTSENYGTYTLTAQWNVDQCTIELDPNVANGGASSNADPFATLYTTYNVGAYKDSARTNLMSTNSNGLLSAPIGKTVTLTADTNNPNSTNDITVSGGTLSGQLSFNGFFSAATGGTQYISQTSPYYILSAGDTAAKGVNTNGTGRCPDTTWYAQYGCFQTTLPTASKPGYTFDGWWTTANNTGTQLNDGDAALCLTADDTVYAHWSKKRYNVNYNLDKGCGDNVGNFFGHVVSNVLTFDEAPNYTVLDITGMTDDSTGNSFASSIYSGYHFVGWLNDNGFNPGGISTPNSVYGQSTPWTYDYDLSFTVECAPNEYTITYDCGTNGGTLQSGVTGGTISGQMVTYPVTYNSQYTLRGTAATCGKTNYTTLSSWSCSWTDESGTSHNEQWSPSDANPEWNPWSVLGNVTCVANYSQNTYSIIYHCGSLPNGNAVGAGSFENGSSNIDTVYNGYSQYIVKPTASTCGSTGQLDGYHFTGWECSPNLATGSSTAVYSVNSPASHPVTVNQIIATIGLSNNANCYAQWEANEVNVIFLKDEDDTTSYSEDSCQYGANGEMFDVPANPTKPGYTFTGWKVIHWDE